MVLKGMEDKKSSTCHGLLLSFTWIRSVFHYLVDRHITHTKLPRYIWDYHRELESSQISTSGYPLHVQEIAKRSTWLITRPFK